MRNFRCLKPITVEEGQSNEGLAVVNGGETILVVVMIH